MTKAVEWEGPHNVKVVEVGKPKITDPRDAVIHITSSTIDGADLYLYHGEVNGMHQGDILGHEFMGFVEEVGPDVKLLKAGDRVVVSAVIACGECFYCEHEQYSLCDRTNPCKEMEEEYGSKLAGMFGHSHLTGGFDGGQAEYARVPIADMNCLKVPEDLSDEKLLFLSDILCAGWHANELGEVKKDQTVAVWGCGPVGLMTMMCAKYRGAKTVIGIDPITYRVEFAKEKLGIEGIDASHEDTIETLHKMFPEGIDVCIDAVGFRYASSLMHRLSRMAKLETDTPEILKECIHTCRKGGIVSVIGDYVAYANQFPIGPLMEKGITLRGSQVFVQKYWEELLDHIVSGEIDPTFVISHVMPLERAEEAYRLFDLKEDCVIEVLLKSTIR
jgi:threonine dehydrogenase-like Zn-dependent dehydrogenase